ncbi:hemerythrin domain-containing protein [Piscinibacter sp. XHJ-5]|uniref:hemerythrin domain-containing protein n=1 Tax=Piscinibacter sp. XHJ-5 TaxID=3037797 RepID=UPI002452C1DE|nr:hemerythrin domain-containing protein [Piscinibacter sp. XHJ-5]
MATRNSSSRSTGATRGSGAKSQIVAMLKADHKKVKKAFKDFEKLDPQEDPEACKSLVEQTLAEVEVHAQLEEQLFYPAARGAVKEEDLIDEAEVEHMTAKVLIEQLKGMQPEDEKFAATFKVLGEYLNHHIQEEEGEMFKQLKQGGAEWDAVLEEMRAQRETLMEEKGMPAEEEQASTGAGRVAAGRSTSRGAAEARPQASAKSSRSRSSEKE